MSACYRVAQFIPGYRLGQCAKRRLSVKRCVTTVMIINSKDNNYGNDNGQYGGRETITNNMAVNAMTATSFIPRTARRAHTHARCIMQLVTLVPGLSAFALRSLTIQLRPSFLPARIHAALHGLYRMDVYLPITASAHTYLHPTATHRMGRTLPTCYTPPPHTPHTTPPPPPPPPTPTPTPPPSLLYDSML